MPRTIGSHFLMHSVASADNSNPQREVESYSDAQKRRADLEGKNPDLNPEQKVQHAHAHEIASSQQKAMEAAQKEREKQEERIEQEKAKREARDKRAEIPQHKRKSSNGQDDDQQEQDNQKTQQKQLFNKADNKIDEQNAPDTKQQFGKSGNKLDKQSDAQEADEDSNDSGMDAKMKDFRSKLPTAEQPRTELTNGQHPDQLSGASKERRAFRDTRIDRSKYDSEEEMHEEGRRQIEAQRVPEDVDEGRPSPANVGRSWILPKKLTAGNWEDIQDKQLKQKAGIENESGPTSPGNYKESIRDYEEKRNNKPEVRQVDMENKLKEMGEPGRKTTMQEALQFQKARENDSPEQQAESQKMRQEEDGKKSAADRITQPGWREQEDPGRLYHQSKEGKEKSGQDDEKPSEKKHLSPAEERKEKAKSAHSQHRNLYEEIARRKAGMTPLEQLDSIQYIDHAAERHEHEEEQGDWNNLEFARSRIRQEEQDWRQRQEGALSKLHEIQRLQESEIEEGEARRQFRERQSRTRDEDEGALSSIKHFASNKWHDLTHGNQEQEKQRNTEFWGRNEQMDGKNGLQQRRTLASPTTPTSGRRALGDSKQQNRVPENEQPAKRGWWFFNGLQHFAPSWRSEGRENTRFIDSLTDDELSMMSL